MEGAFESCYKLEYLDLSNWNTQEVLNMENMFKQCNKLNYLNFSIKDSTINLLSFQKKDNFEFITNNPNLLKLYNDYS